MIRHTSFPIKEGEFINHNREFTGICTDIVNEQFFGAMDNLYHFMDLIFSEYSKAIIKYQSQHNLPQNSIIFIYKGGNVLRIIEQDFLAALPTFASRMLEQLYVIN